MNGIENITKKILDEAAAGAETARAEAAAEAERIAAEAADRAEAERAAILADAGQKAENIALRAVSQGDIAARSRRLTARREVIAKAFEKALEKLIAMDGEKYLSWMERQIKTAQSADAEVILNASDREKYGAALVERAKNGAQSLALAEDTGSFAGGFILREGQIETNCTFEVLINSGREDLEGEIAAVLFD